MSSKIRSLAVVRLTCVGRGVREEMVHDAGLMRGTPRVCRGALYRLVPRSCDTGTIRGPKKRKRARGPFSISLPVGPADFVIEGTLEEDMRLVNRDFHVLFRQLRIFPRLKKAAPEGAASLTGRKSVRDRRGHVAPNRKHTGINWLRMYVPATRPRERMHGERSFRWRRRTGLW